MGAAAADHDRASGDPVTRDTSNTILTHHAATTGPIPIESNRIPSFMLPRARSLTVALCLAVGAAAHAAGNTVYKVIGPDGNVTYQDRAPEPGTPAVERLEVPTDQNVLKSAPLSEAERDQRPGAQAGGDASGGSGAAEEKSAEARRQEAAAIVRRALQAGDAPEGDVPGGPPAAEPTAASP
jgi:hypothetical protein